MSVSFFEGRSLPSHLRRMNGYGDGGDAAASVVNSLTTGAVGIASAVSPWNLLQSMFVAKPIAEEQLQAQAQEAQLAAVSAQQASRAKTVRSLMYVGAGLVGVIILAVALRPPRPAHHAGYRRRRRR